MVMNIKLYLAILAQLDGSMELTDVQRGVNVSLSLKAQS